MAYGETTHPNLRKGKPVLLQSALGGHVQKFRNGAEKRSAVATVPGSEA